MEDQQIVELLWQREERALQEAQYKYGSLCGRIAGNILRDPEDVQECLNDSFLALWNRIPPEKPRIFAAFLGRITRNLALKRYEYNSAAKRNEELETSWEELEGTLCVPSEADRQYEAKQLAEAISAFLWTLDEEPRRLFIRRYWYFDSVRTLAQNFGMSESKVKSMLFRTRNKLRDVLQREGYLE